MDGRRKSYERAAELYAKGLSIAEVAEHYGISRQAMWQWMKARGVPMRPNLRFGKQNHFHRGGKKASDRSQNTLEKAIKKGIVERKTHCEECGASPVFRDGRSGVQAHHPDYNEPLSVMWLCQPCHHRWHRQHRAKERRE